MLLRFGVTNHLSLRDRQELSLVASSLDDASAGLIACTHVPGHRLLPAIVIYGTNASGKSNLIDAIRWTRLAIRGSHSGGEPNAPIPRLPFMLEAACKLAPTQIEVDFVVNNVRYHYGFESTDEAFVAEWLYSFPHDKRQVLFEREQMKFRFGRNLKGRNQVISELTRPNSLFLSAAAQNRHEELSIVQKFFQSIQTDAEQSSGSFGLADRLAGKDQDDRIIQFLSAAGTGIVGYQVNEQEHDERSRKMQEGFRSFLETTSGISLKELVFPQKKRSINLAHRNKSNENVYLEFERESMGTQRLMVLLVSVFRALDDGTPLIVDELDASLHTHACELLFELFASKKTNPKGAQLIATTHDTNLLFSKHLRRDQVWFTEKDREGATHLYPLTEFRTRKSDNLARGYLQGRYGAIPFAGRATDLTVGI